MKRTTFVSDSLFPVVPYVFMFPEFFLRNRNVTSDARNLFKIQSRMCTSAKILTVVY